MNVRLSAALIHPAAICPACAGLLKLILRSHSIYHLATPPLYSICSSPGHQLLLPSTSSPPQWAPPPMHPTGQSAINAARHAGLLARNSRVAHRASSRACVSVIYEAFILMPAFVLLHSSGSSNVVGVHYRVGKKIGEGSVSCCTLALQSDNTPVMGLFQFSIIRPLQFGVIFEGPPPPCPWASIVHALTFISFVYALLAIHRYRYKPPQQSDGCYQVCALRTSTASICIAHTLRPAGTSKKRRSTIAR